MFLYNMVKRNIERGLQINAKDPEALKQFVSDYEAMLDVFLQGGKLTQDQYTELSELLVITE